MCHKNPFVLFEGANCTGKTTLAKRIATILDWNYFYSVPDELIPSQEILSKYGSSEDRFRFYSVCNSLRLLDYQEINCNSGIIVDRYIFSTVAYHSLSLGKSLDDYFYEVIHRSEFRKPSLIIYLTASPDAIRNRIMNRETYSVERDQILSLQQKKLKENYERLFSCLEVPVLSYDTSIEDVDTVVRKLSEEIQNRHEVFM